MDLQAVLNTYTKATLQDMARGLGLTPAPKDRSQLVVALMRAMNDPALVKGALETLSATERALLERVQIAEGEISVGALRVLAARDKLIDQGGRATTTRATPVANSRIFEEQIARLIAHGLLLTTGQSIHGNLLGYEVLSHLVIPPPVLAALPPLPQLKESFAVPAPLRIISADPASFQRDLYLYWSYIRDTAVTLTARSLINKAHLKKINSLLSQTEPVDSMRDELEATRLRFLRHTLFTCGLIDRSADRLVVTATGEAFFAQPLAKRTRIAFESYRNANFWDELLQIPCLVIEGRRTAQSDASAFVVGGRKKLIELFAGLPAEGWLGIEPIIERVRRRSYEFLLPRRSSAYGYPPLPPNPYVSYGNDQAWSFYMSKPGQESYEGYIRNEAEGWNIVEAGMIVAMLREPLHWLGLVDLGLESDADAPDGVRLTAVRPTPIGAHILMNAPLDASETLPSGRLIIQPTFAVLAYPPVSEVQLALLDRIAERGRLEQVAEYRLTRESLYRARQQGLTVEQVIDALQRESGTPLPQNVVYTMIEWGNAQERIVLRDAVALLTVAEPAALDGLLADDKTASAIERRLTNTAALVRSDRLPALEQALLQRGQLPLRQDTPPDLLAGGRWLEMTSEGVITLLASAPELYLRRALQAFSVEDGAALRMTQAGVRQALADGLTLDDLLARLSAWSGDALPQALELQIKSWGGFFGSAQIERPMLLHLEDDRVLQSLLDDPELAPLLHVYQPTGTLAEIDPQHLDLLTTLLQSRGMRLTGVPDLPASEPALPSEPNTSAPSIRRRGRLKRDA